MCGIGGIYTPDGNILLTMPYLEHMRHCLRHRGPDDEGVEILPEWGLGLVHTRLSIIDLTSAGHQPMWNEDRSIGLVFNGEIYNFLDLRRQLETMGVAFRSRTDTEVILRAYEIWGIESISRLNGMFAFAIYDSRQKCLWLARDRLGKKPLYYWYDPNRGIFIFASELKALLVWPFIRREVDREALHCYLALGYVPAPYSMIKGIKKLPAGYWLHYNGERVQLHGYWKIRAIGNWDAARDEYRRAIRHKVEQAVVRRLISDVPLGAFLSGGVDSSIVVGVMSRLMNEPVHTFSAAFEVGARSFKYNIDADMAEIVSQAFGTRHTRLTLRFDGLLSSYLKAVWHMDEPHANPTSVTTYLLASLTKKEGITVVLTGDGGDELFGGYPRYLADRYVSWLRRLPRAPRYVLHQLLAPWPEKTERFLKALQKAELPQRSPEWYLSWWEQFSPLERLALLAPDWREAVETPKRHVQSVLSQIAGADDQDLLSYADLTLWIAEESNMRADKMSMAHALEPRAPFLDYELVELAMSIPFARKVTIKEGKRLLKEAFGDLLPNGVLQRPKWGWLSPVYYWIKDALWEEVRTVIAWLPETGIFSSQVTQFIEEYPLRDTQKVWSLMTFGFWYQMYIARLSLEPIERLSCGRDEG